MHKACAFGVLLIALSVAAPVHVTEAQTVFRWVDERGVVHYSHQPPPPGVQAEARRMVAVRPRSVPEEEKPTAAAEGEKEGAAEEGEKEGAAAEGEASGKGAGTETPVREGKARVELLKQNYQRSGPSSQKVYGSVRNEGGKPAKDVVVAVTVYDAAQTGDQCLYAEVEVKPSTLGPGKTGTFQADLKNPCFFAKTRLEMKPKWR